MVERLNPPLLFFVSFQISYWCHSVIGWLCRGVKVCSFSFSTKRSLFATIWMFSIGAIPVFKHVWCHGGWTTPRMNRLFLFQWILVDGVRKLLIMDWQEESDIYLNQSHHCLGARQLFLKTASYLAWRSCWVWKFVSKAHFPHIGLKKNHNHSLGLNRCPNMTKHHSDLQRPSTKMSF